MEVRKRPRKEGDCPIKAMLCCWLGFHRLSHWSVWAVFGNAPSSSSTDLFFSRRFREGNSFPNSSRGPSWNCPSPSAVLCPFLYRTGGPGRKGQSGAEKTGRTGVASKGGKKEERMRENRSVHAVGTAPLAGPSIRLRRVESLLSMCGCSRVPLRGQHPDRRMTSCPLEARKTKK